MLVCNISDRELAAQNALTLSLAGCGKGQCLRNRKGAPKLCETCARQVVMFLAFAATDNQERQTRRRVLLDRFKV